MTQSTDSAQPGVLIVTCEYAPFPGGIGTYAARLAATLAEHRIDVQVVAPRYAEAPAGLPERVDHRLWFGHHRITPVASLQMAMLARRRAPRDLILAADIRSAMHLWLHSPLHRRGYRVMVHGSEASKLGGSGPLAAIARQSYRTAASVLYNSQATKDLFRRHIPEVRHDAITYLGVDDHWFSPAPVTQFDHPELRVLTLDPARPLFCTIGRLEARKGQIEAVRGIARAWGDLARADKWNKPIYVAAGHFENEAYVRDVKAEAQALGVEAILPGRITQDDAKRLYAHATAHVLAAQVKPGRIEGFGLVLLEAAAMGCPSIASNVGGIPEVLGATGALYEAGDIDRLACHIADFAIRADLRRAKSGEAKRRAEAYSWHACAAATFPELFGRASRACETPVAPARCETLQTPASA